LIRGGDLDAVLEGVQHARRLNRSFRHLVAREVLPGPACDSDDELRTFIRNNAWGHHACGTCRMGPDPAGGDVVDGNFRLHGTRGLRVVDASIFPRIPGFFIVTAIYMVSEKASDVILAHAAS
jgi:choline dehydrogenase